MLWIKKDQSQRKYIPNACKLVCNKIISMLIYAYLSISLYIANSGFQMHSQGSFKFLLINPLANFQLIYTLFFFWFQHDKRVAKTFSVINSVLFFPVEYKSQLFLNIQLIIIKIISPDVWHLVCGNLICDCITQTKQKKKR